MGSCLPGKRKHHPALRNVPSHWRPGESCVKSLRQRRQDGTGGEMSMTVCSPFAEWQRTSWESARKRAGLVAAQAPSSSEILSREPHLSGLPLPQVPNDK